MKRYSIACLFALACTPSIDPAAKADVDAKLAAISPQNRQTPPPSGFEPMPLAVGQWTKHKVIDQNGRPSLMTYKVIGQEGDAWWLETVMEGYSGRHVMKMLASLGNRKDPSTVDLRDAWIMDKNGRVTHYDGATLAIAKSMMKGNMSMLEVGWQGFPQEDTFVPAGTFAACYKGRTDVSVMGFSSSTMGWYHPAVPLSGMVKSRGIDKPTSMELVDFGMNGAQSDFPAANTTVATPPQ